MKAGLDCLDVIAESMNRAIGATKDLDVKLVIENTAGQGSNLGYKFEHLAHLIDKIGDKSRVGVCIDTCHMFTAGYGMRAHEKPMMRRGTVFTVLLLMNISWVYTSMTPNQGWVSRVDKYQSLGQGEIGAGMRLNSL